MYTLREVTREYGDRCFYCGGKAETVDHLIPRAKHGGDHLGNLRPSCVTDNALKGRMLPPEWDAYRETADYRRKYDSGYGTYRSGQKRRAEKRALDEARKTAVRTMRVAAVNGDKVTVAQATARANAAIAAARDLRIQNEALSV